MLLLWALTCGLGVKGAVYAWHVVSKTLLSSLFSVIVYTEVEFMRTGCTTCSYTTPTATPGLLCNGHCTPCSAK